MANATRRSALAILAGAALAPFPGRGAKKATAFALIGDRYHNSDYIRIGLGKTLSKDAGVSIDFYDEVKFLDAESLQGYKLLIVFRDGMTWPDGYTSESSNAGYVGTGSPKIISEPPLPKWSGEANYWITPAQ